MWIGLKAMKWLSLEFNNITHVEEYGFANLPQLEELYLDNNKLTAFPMDIFNPADFPFSGGHPPKMTLTLHSNPLSHGNELCWIQEEDWIQYPKQTEEVIMSLCYNASNSITMNGVKISSGYRSHFTSQKPDYKKK